MQRCYIYRYMSSPFYRQHRTIDNSETALAANELVSSLSLNLHFHEQCATVRF